MGIKTIGLQEEVYERLKSRKREGESFTEVVNRLIDKSGVNWRETFGTLPDEEGEKLEQAAARSREATGEGLADRQREVIGALADDGKMGGD